jgi:hypothetical protein
MIVRHLAALAKPSPPMKGKRMRKISLRGGIITAVSAAVVLAGGTLAVAATGVVTAAGPKPVSVYACERSGHVTVSPVSTPSSRCPAGTTSVVIGARGPAGPAGAKGATGATGATGQQGPSGVVAATTTDLGGVASVATGGGFVANATAVGTVDLKAGTYLLSLAAKATPLMTSGVQVFPQFFVYDQAANAAFAGDLFNAGSGALESGGHVTIDSYYSGSAVVTLASDTEIRVYAFGYDSDQSAGSYALDDLTVTAVQLQVAG